MKIKIGHIFIILCVLSCAGFSTRAQPVLSKDKNVKDHKAIDAIYGKFAAAYKDLSPDAVAGLYTANADYVAGGSAPLKGRAAILDSFRGFFNGVKERGQNLEITFHIEQREVGAAMGYDIGVYTLANFKDGKKLDEGRGRFIVVTKKIGGQWFFQVDSYTNLPQEKK